ncbi:hypothetical protein [Salirhabdus salicampi]|uniref:hypothetical protein n=1 Tax=Salirhabdus salicampi TaxID=476102 RepID=UPI0020C31B20|nr:hypothetical protein [Salirhabdus salicampi]MCP8616212.1 hypothetical protein [Salirhabdus salicampi]
MKHFMNTALVFLLIFLSACGGTSIGDHQGANIQFDEDFFYITDLSENAILVVGGKGDDRVDAKYLKIVDKTIIYNENGDVIKENQLQIGQRIQFILDQKSGCEESFPEQCQVKYIALAGKSVEVPYDEEGVVGEEEAVKLALDYVKKKEQEDHYWVIHEIEYEKHKWKMKLHHYLEQSKKIVVYVDGKSKNVHSEVTEKNELERLEKLRPPTPAITVDHQELNVETGSYMWSDGDKSVTADSFHPKDLVKKYQQVLADSVLNIAFDYSPHTIEWGIWTEDGIHFQPVENYRITLPEKPNKYVLVIKGEWEEGESIYAVGIVLK